MIMLKRPAWEGPMTEQQVNNLRELSRQYIHLLSELHAGNAYSKEQLWKWLQEAESKWNKSVWIGSR